MLMKTGCQNWEEVAKILQKIWTGRKIYYLNNLQECSKWKFKRNDVQEGTLVLIREENLLSTKWTIGRIAKVFKGEDSLIRVTNLHPVR